MSQKQQTFNDGVVKIYSTENTSEPGNKPKEGLALKETLCYEERVVGIKRYYAAMQNNVRIDMVLRCPIRRNVGTQDIAIPIDEEQYKIKQVQYPPDVMPKSMDLSLERVDEKYELN